MRAEETLSSVTQRMNTKYIYFFLERKQLITYFEACTNQSPLRKNIFLHCKFNSILNPLRSYRCKYVFDMSGVWACFINIYYESSQKKYLRIS